MRTTFIGLFKANSVKHAAVANCYPDSNLVAEKTGEKKISKINFGPCNLCCPIRPNPLKFSVFIGCTQPKIISSTSQFLLFSHIFTARKHSQKRKCQIDKIKDRI